MKCPSCKTNDTLFAQITLTIKTPILKGGGVKPGRVSLDDVKNIWAEGTKRVSCDKCAAEFQYVTGEGLVQVGLAAPVSTPAVNGDATVSTA